ncbi:MAG: sugar O-acetyltransferase [Chloroflexi bacterium]|nr:MAG: sugar O-acetyltransferase [Chloroflexota bacterium]
MPINKYQFIVTLLKTNPGELFDVLGSALTTFEYRFIKRCIGKNTIIRQKTVIRNYANVKIGEGSILQDYVYIRAGVQGSIVLGKGCMVNSFCRIFGHGGIEIGNYAQLGPGVTITTTDHDYNQSNRSETFKKVTIGSRAWIGANATILPGVTIGENTVVGAGSIVSKDLPPNVVAVGAPARVIKEIDVPGNSNNFLHQQEAVFEQR